MNSLYLKNALCVATCDGRDTILPGGGILIRDREIAQVGPVPDVLPDDCRVMDVSGCLVVPGFVNTHHHFFQVLTRVYRPAQNAGLFEWLTKLYGVWQYLEPEHSHAASRAAMAELLLSGCTTAADHMYLLPAKHSASFIDRQIGAAKELGIRFHPCHGAMTMGVSRGGLPPDSLVQKEEAVLLESERLISRYHDPDDFSMCRVALAPCAPFNVTPELMKETARLARDRKVRLHTHLAETRDEEEFCLARYGKRPLDFLDGLGWLGSDVWYAHAIHLSAGEMDLMAATGTGVAHCPSSNMRLGSGIAPVRELLDRGVPVGLAVDGSSSNDSSGMRDELRQCLFAQRARYGASGITALEALKCATRGGARVLGRNDTGSIEPGKAADIAVFDMRRLEFAGATDDPVAALVLCGGRRPRTVIVNGAVVVEDGRLVNGDEDEIARAANEASRALLRKACD